MQLQNDYFASYRSLKLTRDAHGVLVVEFHTKGGPFRFTGDLRVAQGKPFLISWSAVDADGDALTYMVMASLDGGRSWSSRPETPRSQCQPRSLPEIPKNYSGLSPQMA